MPTRVEQTERIGREVLAAAREEFLASGFHGTTIDRIAAAAGYTKGAVYSRFESKADLFLALLEERIEARSAENVELAAELAGADGLAELSQRWTEIQQRDLAWTLLVVEFRVHAARTPALAARYAELHGRTLEALEALILELVDRAGERSTLAPRVLAQALLSMGTGATLEQAVDPEAFPPELVARLARSVVVAA